MRQNGKGRRLDHVNLKPVLPPDVQAFRFREPFCLVCGLVNTNGLATNQECDTSRVEARFIADSD